jgi:hypothetical protein
MMSAKPGSWLAALTSAERKEVAMEKGLYAYFPDALALVARHSVRSNEKHNPGTEPHWAREKSKDHGDCIGRHHLAIAVDRNSLDDGQPHIVCRAWRALADLQIWAEEQRTIESKFDGGWREWRGGDCPTHRDAIVQIIVRDLGLAQGRAGQWRWSHNGNSGDIVKYRVIN